MKSPQIRTGDDGGSAETVNHQFPYREIWNSEEIAAHLKLTAREISPVQQILAMILDNGDTLKSHISTSDIWDIRPDFIIENGRILRVELPDAVKQTLIGELTTAHFPKPPVNPFAMVTAAKATYSEGGLSPQQRLDGVTDILATIASRVVKKQGEQHQKFLGMTEDK